MKRQLFYYKTGFIVFVKAFLSERCSNFRMHFIECHKSLCVLNSLNGVSKFTARYFREIML